MVGAEVSVNLSDKHSAVFVAHPTSDGQKVDPRHDAVAHEMVPAVMEAESVQSLGVDTVSKDTPDSILEASKQRSEGGDVSVGHCR